MSWIAEVVFELRFSRAQRLAAAGRTPAALALYERLVASRPADTILRIHEVQTRLFGGDAAGALEALDHIESGGGPVASLMAGRLAYLAGDVDRAASLLEDAGRADPSNALSRAYAAVVATSRGQIEATARLVREGLPDSLEALALLAMELELSQVEESASRQGLPEEGAISTPRCETTDGEWARRGATPGRRRKWLVLDADALIARGGELLYHEDLDGAQACYEEVRRGDPAHQEVHAYLGEIHYLRGDFGRALEALELRDSLMSDEERQASPLTPPVLGYKGRAYLYLGRTDLARDLLDKALAAGSQFPEDIYGRGLVEVAAPVEGPGAARVRALPWLLHAARQDPDFYPPKLDRLVRKRSRESRVESRE